jgi:metallophosphoesterase superfamily enzyme
MLTAASDRVPVAVVRGNHDGDIQSIAAEHDRVSVADGDGLRIGPLGFAHGHTWPSRTVLEAGTLCLAHEHPAVSLEDEVGGRRVERAWLRGSLDPVPFRDRYDGAVSVPDRFVVFPAFNGRSGGTWINVTGQEFLSPFLPDAVADGEAYLLDGTRLGPYRQI